MFKIPMTKYTRFDGSVFNFARSYVILTKGGCTLCQIKKRIFQC